MTTPDPYKILNIQPDATQTEVKKAYRRLVKQFHPDSQTDTANHQKIVEINAAYEVLGDSQRRQQYDRQKSPVSSSFDRQKRTAAAQQQYQKNRQADHLYQQHLEQWLQEIYSPLNRLISRILNSLSRQIDDLSADPFDDELMENFQDYLQGCGQYLEQAKKLFASQPNPPQCAKVAAYLYYSLNHLGEGLEDLSQFTFNYDEHYLHSGQELFYRAYQMHAEAKHHMAQMG